jgi:hypothetical protein
VEYKKGSLGAGGVAQVVECLPSKCEALSSNPGPTKKRKYDLHKKGSLVEKLGAGGLAYIGVIVG